jgi:hypothetical protein
MKAYLVQVKCTVSELRAHSVLRDFVVTALDSQAASDMAVKVAKETADQNHKWYSFIRQSVDQLPPVHEIRY